MGNPRAFFHAFRQFPDGFPVLDDGCAFGKRRQGYFVPDGDVRLANESLPRAADAAHRVAPARRLRERCHIVLRVEHDCLDFHFFNLHSFIKSQAVLFALAGTTFTRIFTNSPKKKNILPAPGLSFARGGVVSAFARIPGGRRPVLSLISSGESRLPDGRIAAREAHEAE